MRFQHDKFKTETRNYEVSETAIKDKSLLGTHSQELCDNTDAKWMTPTCNDDDAKESKRLHPLS